MATECSLVFEKNIDMLFEFTTIHVYVHCVIIYDPHVVYIL